MAKRKKYAYEVAPDVQAALEEIVAMLPDQFPHVDVRRVVCYRSRGSTARIYARIWALPGIWQHALGVQPHYVIEVVERFDRESLVEREKTLIHELMHIPKTFSGNLVPHKCFGKNIDCKSVDFIHDRLVAARRVHERARLLASALAASSPPSPSL